MALRPFLIGLLAAAAGFAVTQGLWALSAPHHPWVALLFALFPTPVVIETARLVALYVIFGATGAGRGGVPFAVGFSLALAAGDAALPLMPRDGAEGWLGALAFWLGPLTVLALNLFLSLSGVAIKKTNAPPMAIFCVLAILHGAHNGGFIAIDRELASLSAIAIRVAAILAYAAAAFWLARRLDSLRGENRRGVG